MDKDQQSLTSDTRGSLAHSANWLEHSARQQTDSADRRTKLAADTGLAALASGIGARALLENIVPGRLAGATASVLFLFSGFCFVAAVWREMAPVAPPQPDTKRLPAWLLIAVNGFLVIVVLAALVGIWLR